MVNHYFFRYLYFGILTSWLVFGIHTKVKAQAQPVPALTYQSFNSGLGLAAPNTGGPGPNVWTVSSNYEGAGPHPATPDQTMATGGSINGPNEGYLHVHNPALPADNAAYNPNVASDNLVELNRNFCTLNLTNVQLSFFWLCEGGADAYGEVLYSTDGGTTWQVTTSQVGRTQYNGQSAWTLESIAMPEFNDQQSLRFAFRWVNGTGGTVNLPMAVDDIFLTASYDPSMNPIDLTVRAEPEELCIEGEISRVFVTSSSPLCPGTVSLQMSNSSGGYPNPPITLIGYSGISFNDSGDEQLTFFDVPIPQTSGVFPPDCRNLRVVYTERFTVTGASSDNCIQINNCPNLIQTAFPAVALEDSVCVNSVIDVRFRSTGSYLAGNRYVIELSDSTGSFDNPWELGSNASNRAFPANPPEGAVSGMVMEDIDIPGLEFLPPGCDYYVRIRATSPAGEATMVPAGPFCIKHCDLETNNYRDFEVCLPYSEESTHTISYEDTALLNFPANTSLRLRVLRMADNDEDGVLDSLFGGGVREHLVTTDSEGNFTFTMPPASDILPLGFAPNPFTPHIYNYYARIEASHPSFPGGIKKGTLIRFTINTFDDSELVLRAIDPVTFNTINNPNQFDLMIFAANDPKSVAFEVDYAASGLSFNSPGVFEWRFGGQVLQDWEEDYLVLNSTAGLTPASYNVSVRLITENRNCRGNWYTFPQPVIVQRPATSLSELTSASGDAICIGQLAQFGINPALGPGVTLSYEFFANGQPVDDEMTLINVGVPLRFIPNRTGEITIRARAVDLSGSTGTVERVINIEDGPTNEELNATLPIGQTIDLCQGQPYSLQLAEGLVADFSSTRHPNFATNVSQANYPTDQVQAVPDRVRVTVRKLGAEAGCENIAEFFVIVHPVPQPSFTASPDIGGRLDFDTQNTVTFINTSQNATSHRWIFPSDLVTDVTDEVVTVTFPEQGLYTIGLEASNEFCSATETRTIELFPRSTLAYPTAFSPNNDGLNDEFIIWGRNLVSGSLLIFDRWGRLVADAPGTVGQASWDGRFNGSGEFVPEGVYVWRFQGLNSDGSSVEASGTVTIVK